MTKEQRDEMESLAYPKRLEILNTFGEVFAEWCDVIFKAGFNKGVESERKRAQVLVDMCYKVKTLRLDLLNEIENVVPGDLDNALIDLSKALAQYQKAGKDE